MKANTISIAKSYKDLKGPDSPDQYNVYLTTVEAWLEGRKNFKIKPYKNNRGRVGIKKAMLNKIEKNFNVLGLGTFPLAESSTGHFEMVDAHTRDAALHNLDKSGKLSEQDKDSTIIVCVYHEDKSRDLYQNLNQNISHKTKEKATNPDYLIGAVLKNFENYINQKIPDSYIASVLDIIFYVNESGGKKMYLEDVFKSRGKWSKLVDESSTSRAITLKNNKIEPGKDWPSIVATAYDYYLKVAAESEKGFSEYLKEGCTGRQRTALENMFKGPGMLITIMTDYLGDRKITNQSAKGLAKKIVGRGNAGLKRAVQLHTNATTVAQRGRGPECYQEIIKTLK